MKNCTAGRMFGDKYLIDFDEILFLPIKIE